jgi:hypothetical protein
MIVDAKGTVYEQLRFLHSESSRWGEPMMQAETHWLPTWWLWTGAIAVAVAQQEAMNLEGGW